MVIETTTNEYVFECFSGFSTIVLRLPISSKHEHDRIPLIRLDSSYDSVQAVFLAKLKGACKC